MEQRVIILVETHLHSNSYAIRYPDHYAMCRRCSSSSRTQPTRVAARRRVLGRRRLPDHRDAAGVGQPIGEKTSTAFAPPELGRQRFVTGGCLASAQTSFDVWSLGMILYELCSGRNFLAQDIANDELVEPADRTRLVTSRIITDAKLAALFSSGEAEAGAGAVEAAKNLIRWSLKGNPEERPTVRAPEPMQRRELCHVFLSHAQKGGGPRPADLRLPRGRLGVRLQGEERRFETVEDALNNHEALTYRPRSEGHTRHEFSTTTEHLLEKLGAEGAAVVAEAEAEAGTAPATPPLQEAEDKVQAQMEADRSFTLSPEVVQEQQAAIQEVARLRQTVAARDAEIAALKAMYEQ